MAKKNKNQEGLVPSPGQALAVISGQKNNNGNGTHQRLPWWLWVLAGILLPIAPFLLLVRWIASRLPRRPHFGGVLRNRLRRLFSALGRGLRRFFVWLATPVIWFANFLRQNWHLIFWVLMVGCVGATLYFLRMQLYMPSAYTTLFSYVFGTIAYRFQRYANVPEEDREAWRQTNARFSGVFVFFAIALFFLIIFTIFYGGQ